MNGWRDKNLVELRTRFDHSMNLNRSLFGNHAFRKSLAEDNANTRRSILNIAFFDVCSVVFSEISEKPSERQQRALKKAIIGLLADDDFSFSITYSTNSTNQVQTRFEMAREAIEGVFS
jgi:hypothetical protein